MNMYKTETKHMKYGQPTPMKNAQSEYGVNNEQRYAHMHSAHEQT